jgi:hypothetical protein
MEPNQVSEVLRKIAGAIDNSKTPDKRLVVADLKTVIAQIQQTGQQEQQQQQGQQEQQGQQDQQGQQQQALPKSQGGKGMLKKLLDDAQKALDSGDDSGFKKSLETALKNAV